MSYVNPSKLKGLNDLSLSFFTTTLAFTTSVLTVDSLTQFGGYIKAFRIVNNDNTNSVSWIQGGLSQPVKQLTPVSEIVSNGWESFIQITPNAVTGTGFLEIDIVSRQSAEIA